jgi:hypothetical protein
MRMAAPPPSRHEAVTRQALTGAMLTNLSPPSVSDAEIALADLRAGRMDSLAIRYLATAGASLVAPALARLRRKHPGVRIDLKLIDPRRIHGSARRTVELELAAAGRRQLTWVNGRDGTPGPSKSDSPESTAGSGTRQRRFRRHADMGDSSGSRDAGGGWIACVVTG